MAQAGGGSARGRLCEPEWIALAFTLGPKRSRAVDGPPGNLPACRRFRGGGIRVGNTMPLRTAISTVVLATAGAVGAFSTTPASLQAPQPAPVFLAAALDRTAESRVEGDLAMDDAVAASLVGAITLQFPKHRIEVKLDKVDVAPLSLRDRAVSGEAKVRIGNDDAWLPVAFNALYDTQDAVVTQPHLVFGSDAPASMLPRHSALLEELSEQVNGALASEFGQQAAQMRIEHGSSSPAGTRYLHVQAVGMATFEGEGNADAQVEGLYDHTTGQWLRVSYDLGDSATPGDVARS